MHEIFRRVAYAIVFLWDDERLEKLRQLCFWLIVAVVPVLLWVAGPWIVNLYGHDVLVLLDGGWRVLNGQKPHLDFSTGLGPMMPMLVATGMLLTDGSATALAYLESAMFLVFAIWAWAVTGARMQSTERLMAVAVVAFLAAGAYPLGWTRSYVSYAMVYNRYGYALLGIIILVLLQIPRRPSSNRADIALYGSAGIALGLLCFLKLNFFLVGLAVLGVAFVLRFCNARHVLSIIAGWVVTFLLFLAFLNFRLDKILADITMVLKARTEAVTRELIKETIRGTISDVGVVLLVLLVLPSGPVRRQLAGRLTDLQILSVTGIVYAGSLLLNLTNAQKPSVPLLSLLAIILLNQGRLAAQERYTGLPLLLRAAAVFASFVFLVMPTSGRDAISAVEASVRAIRSDNSGVVRFEAAHVRPLRLMNDPMPYPCPGRPDPPYEGPLYTKRVNDGVDLLRKNSSESEAVLTFELANPFNYNLRRHPPVGDSLWWHYKYAFSKASHLPPDRVFSRVGVVMVPKNSGMPETTEGLKEVYGLALDRDYVARAESNEWILYKRRGPQ